MVNDDLFLD